MELQNSSGRLFEYLFNKAAPLSVVKKPLDIDRNRQIIEVINISKHTLNVKPEILYKFLTQTGNKALLFKKYRGFFDEEVDIIALIKHTENEFTVFINDQLHNQLIDVDSVLLSLSWPS